LDFVHKTIRGRADQLPFKNGEFDVALLRGVLQHIPTDRKLKSLQEMHRVLKNGGIAYIMIPPWWSPLSGQNIKPFQYFGFPLAKHFSNTIMGRKIMAKNLAELGLWPMTFRSTLRYIEKTGFKILKTTDILGRMHFLTKISIVREVLVNSAGFIIKKTD
jgi:ubiquinone/menaquinone biosynthesis C-methylase UbiE